MYIYDKWKQAKNIESLIVEMITEILKENKTELEDMEILEPHLNKDMQNTEENHKLFNLLKAKYGVNSDIRPKESNIFVIEDFKHAEIINLILNNKEMREELNELLNSESFIREVEKTATKHWTVYNGDGTGQTTKAVHIYDDRRERGRVPSATQYQKKKRKLFFK